MLKRILIGAALIGGLAAIVIADRWLGYPILGAALLAVAALLAQRELLLIFRGRSRPVSRLVAVATAALFVTHVALHWTGRDDAIPGALTAVFLGSVFAILVQAVLRMDAGRESELARHRDDVAAGVLAMAYVALPMIVTLGLLLSRPAGEGSLYAATLVLISKCGDMGGYLVGTLIGRHRVFPKVSPKKSYEGSAGGLLLTLGLAVVAWRVRPDFFPGFSWATISLFAVVVNLATQAGDFAESMLKRACEVKDSADLLPTFGGALDIIDSLVFAMPAAALFIWIMA